MPGRLLKRASLAIRKYLHGLRSEDRAGIYITVIIHLTVIIVLMAVQISTELQKENTFVMDFSQIEAEEKRIQEEAFKEEISRRLDDMINGRIPVPRTDEREIRNIAVDAGSHLKDDRNTDAEQLYKDAERLDQELRQGQKQAIYEDAADDAVEIPQKGNKAPEKEYSGPSVLSYTLDGRKASHLRIPAYRCYSGGEVTVIITVDPSGRVLNAKVMDDVSSQDPCLREFAVRAARLSRFSSSTTAPARQTGEIVYRFIAQ